MPEDNLKLVIFPKNWDGAVKTTPSKTETFVTPEPETAAKENPDPPIVFSAAKLPL
jgi:hypothetical protein